MADGKAGMAHLVNAPINDPLFWRLVFNARVGARQYLAKIDTKTFGGDGGLGIGSLARSYDVVPRALPGFRLAR
jgi:hypothetical protein